MLQGGGDIVSACPSSGVTAPDVGEQGVCSVTFVAEGEDEAADNGNGVTCASVPHGLAFDPFLLVVECGGDKGGQYNFPTSCGKGGEAAGANEEGDIADSEWGGLGVCYSLIVISGAGKE